MFKIVRNTFLVLILFGTFSVSNIYGLVNPANCTIDNFNGTWALRAQGSGAESPSQFGIYQILMTLKPLGDGTGSMTWIQSYNSFDSNASGGGSVLKEAQYTYAVSTEFPDSCTMMLTGIDGEGSQFQSDDRIYIKFVNTKNQLRKGFILLELDNISFATGEAIKQFN